MGYKSEKGSYKVIEKNGLLGITTAQDPEKGLMNVELYQDIRGEYFPLLTELTKTYAIRGDGRVEEVTLYADSSVGKVVHNIRGRIKKEVSGVVTQT